MKVFHHRGDLDGLASGAIIRKKYPDAILVGAEYGENVDQYISMVTPGEDVIVVDYIMQPFSKMLELAKKCNLLWIDHHWSAIKEFKAYELKFGTPFKAIVGTEENQLAACHLTWATMFPLIPVPKAVDYLSTYDVWRHNEDRVILGFQFGARYHLHSATDENWSDVLSSDQLIQNIVIKNYVGIGNILLRWTESGNKYRAFEHAFEMEFAGYKALVINTTSKGSHLFKDIAKPEHKLLIVFSLTAQRKWKFSIYSTDNTVDCSAICKQFGGGGHKSAAGFTTDTLPW